MSDNAALDKARKRLASVSRILLRRPSQQTRPKWEKVRELLKKQIRGLEGRHTK